MTDEFLHQVSAIIAQYKKHGWTLSRVLLSMPANDVDGLFEEAEVIASDIDAAWFTRSSAGQDTWELRSLAGPPFALLEVIKKDIDNTGRAAILTSMEERLRDSLRQRRGP